MPSVKVSLWSSKCEDGLCPLYLVLRHKKGRSVIALPVRVSERNWNAKAGEVRKTHRDSVKINRYLIGQVEAAESALLSAVLDGVPNPTKAAKAQLTDTADGDASFTDYARELQRGYRDRGKIGTAKSIGSALGKMDQFSSRVKFSDVNATFVRRFADWLVREKGNRPNTVHKSVGHLRSIWLQAKREGLVSGDNPFLAVRIKKEKGEKRRLTYDEIRRIESAALAGFTFQVRDWFMFSFYAGGLRFSDVALLKRSSIQGGRLVLRQKKTGGAAGVLIVPQAAEILSRQEGAHGYVFPIMRTGSRGAEDVFKEIGRRNAHANKELKVIAKRCGLPPISFHMARHSVADHARRQGVAMRDIQAMLGHDHYATTETYLSQFDRDRLDDVLRGLF